MTDIYEQTMESIRSEADQLRTKAESFLSSREDNPLHDAEFMKAITHGLQLKDSCGLFSEEETQLMSEITELQKRAIAFAEIFQQQTLALIREEKEASNYSTRIGTPLEVLREENQRDLQESSALLGEVFTLYSLAKAQGWLRYEELLANDPDRALKEAKEIVSSVTIIETSRLLDSVAVQFPQALHAEVNTENYGGRRTEITPKPFTSNSNTEQIESVKNFIAPLLYHHKKAVALSDNPNDNIDVYIALKARELSSLPATEVPEEEYKSYVTPTVDTVNRFTGKVINSLSKLEHNEMYDVDVKNRRHKRKKKSKKVDTQVLVRYDSDKLAMDIVSISGKPFDKEDEELLNAILTLWENQRKQTQQEVVEVVVTPQILHQRVTGEPNARISKEQYREYIERCIKLDCIKIFINAKEEALAYYGEGSFNDSISDMDILYGSIVNIAIHPAIINGNHVRNAIHIFGFNHSPIYQYAKATGQISSTKKELLPSGVLHKNTENNRIDKYLLYRIEGRKGMGNIILVSSIFEEAEIDLSTFKEPKNKRKRVLSNIEKLMDGYVGTGLITSWKYHSRGRVNKYSIEFFTKRNQKTDTQNGEAVEK